MAGPRGILVFDAGSTNTKLFLFDGQGQFVCERRTASASHVWPGYRALDAEPALSFFRAVLPEFDAILPVDVIVPCAHGSGLALLDEKGALALPVMDYMAEPPAAIAEAYRRIEPPFSEGYAPTNPMALTLGLQLYWQENAYDQAFARVRTIMPWGQYIAWRMSGCAASELTALGAQTHLIRPLDNIPTRLAVEHGWDRLLAPIRPAWDVLGRLRDEFVASPLRGRLAVKVGIHDSNANYARYLAASLSGFTLLSTGTWIIIFNSDGDITTLDPARDTATNTDIFGRPVACSRFMGGNEIELVAGKADPSLATLEETGRLIEKDVMALPSFSRSGGPLPHTGGKGRIVGAMPEGEASRAALGALYCALMTDLSLDAVGSTNQIIIDGPFSQNRVFCAVLAALRPDQPVMISDLRDGTAAGAALVGLFERRQDFPERPLALRPVSPPLLPGLEPYRARWRAAGEKV